MIHIVPTVPPEVNGLGDYCFKIWSHWPEPKPAWNCVALHIPQKATQHWPQANYFQFDASSQSLLNVLDGIDDNMLVLHYVGYGYQLKGAPLWLPSPIKEWKSKNNRRRVGIVFHELWAIGAPWRSCFWVMPFAKKIVAELERESDFWFTSCQLYFDRIVGVGGSPSKGKIVPIAPTIESKQAVSFHNVWPLAHRAKLKIAIFGQAPTRMNAIRTHQNLLKSLCEQDFVEHITLIGQKEKNIEQLESVMGSVGFPELWKQSYDLTETEISNLLLKHDIGLLKETPPILTKSSVFASLCAHGVLTICAAGEKGSAPPIINGQKVLPYLTSDDSNPTECIDHLRDETRIEETRVSLEQLATTSLSWPSTISTWQHHMGFSD